jgi:hypothetical protein
MLENPDITGAAGPVDTESAVESAEVVPFAVALSVTL